MKKMLFTLIFVAAAMTALAQTNYTAVVPGNEQDLKNFIEKGTLTFEIGPITDAKQIDLLVNKATPYKKEMNLEVKAGDKTAVVVATMDDKGKDMRWLYRYFLSTGTSQVSFNGKTVSTQDFFKPWM